VLRTLDEQVTVLQGQVDAHFGQHPDAEIISSQPGLGPILGARVLAEFGDDADRYLDAKARKNYASTSPITHQSSRKKIVLARFVHNDRLIDALGRQAFASLNASPGAHAYYDQLRSRGTGHHSAARWPPDALKAGTIGAEACSAASSRGGPKSSGISGQ
jgi:hypothetical protein